MKKIFLIVMALMVMLCVPCAAEERGVEGAAPYEGDPSAEVSGEAGGSLGEAIAGYFEAFSEFSVEDWEAFISDTVVPVVMMVITAIASIYIAISPIMAKVKSASNKFKAATTDVNAATSDVAAVKAATAKAAEDMNTRYAQMRAEFDSARVQMSEQFGAAMAKVNRQYEDFRDRVDGKVDAVGQTADKIQQMLLIGLCNNEDLVHKGYARQIARVAQGEGADVALSVIASDDTSPQGGGREESAEAHDVSEGEEEDEDGQAEIATSA